MDKLITAIVPTSEDTVSFLDTVLPLKAGGIPVVVVGQDQRELSRALNCRIYEGGKTFGRRLLAGLRKVETEYFVFFQAGVVLSDLNFLREAVEILSIPEVGLVVPALPRAAGPQILKLQDERIVQLASFELMKLGRFGYVLPSYVLDVEDTSSRKLDSRFVSNKLEPVLIYRYTRSPEVPVNAKSLFEDVITCDVLNIPEIKPGKLIFVLKEGEDFTENFTKEHLAKLCNNPDPFVFAYQFPILRSWKDGWFIKDQVTWEVRAFASFEKIASRILINPYYSQQLPYEGTRPVNVSIVKKVSDLPSNSTVAEIRTPTLTIASMMKNEMKNLPTYLSAAIPFAQQVVLVDTGSEDESPDFAEFFGAEVIKATLNKDFSKIRNLYLKVANGLWLFQQDLDEVVDYKQIYSIMMEAPEDTEAIQLQVHNLTPQDGVIIYQDAIRLIKHPRTWYYSNRVHETVERCASEENRRVSRVDNIVIYHFGFLSPNMKEKLSLYRELISMQIKEEPENPMPYFNLALDLLNEYEEHPENLDLALKLLLQTISLHPSFALAQYEVSRVYCQKALEAIERTLEYVPPNHPMLNAIRKVYGPLKEYTERYIVK